MPAVFEVDYCGLCSTVHPRSMTCDEAIESRAKGEQKGRESRAAGTVWMNRLVNWRTIIIGKLWGTRPMDPATEMARDLLATHLCMRAEINALTKLIVEGGIVSPDAQDAQLARAARFRALIENEAEWLSRQYEKQFPGIRAIDEGLALEPEAANTMRDWPK